MSFPTLTEIEDANWDYLTTNANAWTNLANTWEAAFTEIRDASTSPGGIPWTGTGAQAFQHRAAADVMRVHGPADMLRNAAGIANRGAQDQHGNKSLVLSAVNTAERQDFRVGDDYSVTDTWTYYSSAAEQAQREQAADDHASFIKSRAANLVNNEQEIARQLTTATAGLHEFTFGEEGSDGGAGGNLLPQAQAGGNVDPADMARQRDQAVADDPAADPTARRLAQERLDDLRNSQFIGPLPTNPVLGGDARTRAQARRQLQDFLESGQAYPNRPPLTPDQATHLLDRCEFQARVLVLRGFADQLNQAGVSPAGIQRALDEVQGGKPPQQLIHEAGSGISSGVGGLGSGLSSQADALPQGRHWGDAPAWSKTDADALKTLGKRLSLAGISLDGLLTVNDILNGAPASEEVPKLGGRTAGAWLGGFAAGAAWGSWVGPEGTVLVGLLGSIAGGFGGDKLVQKMMGG
ncbi:hypothetical protein [Mycolicibacter heraklionensis]|uniref:hypothetical protein n=1 Tax=Mycolicibacter heraklionensis TaxID=512402 RepID=UPI0007E9EC51|nr:hypothetical protein [Mycolicibacter heraklionensis]OBG35436.1 hypothetical protein A5671_22860 [Mycolicibacter heraklionensis]